MDFVLKWTPRGFADYAELRDHARQPKKHGKKKSSEALGLFKQVNKTLTLLSANPKHPGLNTHEYDSLENPHEKGGKVWEAYVQNNTPGAYRLFWCYGPSKGEITVLAITPHP